MNEESLVERLARMNREFMPLVPLNVALGLECLDLARGEAWMKLPYSAKLAGDPERGVLHGGAITTLMDACSGAAVFMALDEPTPIATLDLRIDYLKPADPPLDVIAHATCYRVTRQVAFVRCLAYHDDESRPIAAGSGTFMLTGARGAGQRAGGAQ